MPQPTLKRELSNFQILLAGASAGLAVDLVLYPIDTVKTRLQSKEGFVSAGGFKKIYAGTSSVAIGSAPGAAFFFVAYEGAKGLLKKVPVLGDHPSACHMAAAPIGEVVACLVRVPTEILKQRAQARADLTVRQIFNNIRTKDGPLGFYRGFGTTVLREIPFSIIQFPLWEWFKVKWKESQENAQLQPWQGAICGSVAGGISAALTTPLDVAKTRIMLNTGVGREATSTIAALRSVYAQLGLPGLFSGVLPRTVAMTIGGFIFFGAYELSSKILRQVAARDSSVYGSLQPSLSDRIADPFVKKTPRTFEEMRERSRALAEKHPELKR